MSVQYKLVKQATPGIKGGGDYKYYVRACNRRKTNLYDVAGILAQRSSLTRGDVIATLTGLIELIPELLLNNQTVELDHLGIFSLNLKSKPEDKPRTDSFRQIKSARISFRPSTRLKDAVRFPEYRKSKDSEY